MRVKLGLGWLVTVCVPVVLVLLAVRVVMSPWFLQFEYTRPGFPVDLYGFTTEDRLRYGPVAIEYMLTDADISLLRDLDFGATGAAYTERELQHMIDVKNVTQAAFLVLRVALGVLAVCAVVLRRDGWILREGLKRGALLTLMAIVAVVVSAVVAWDFFFTLFHELFFADGTWVFLYSDTLIRLYPEQFWFDAALTVGTLTVVGALVLFAGMRWIGGRVARRGGAV
ncbi:MAG: TIGR01906 family membrane protein [Anaerolineae bacterium]|nr:TIGR01906 family membrane protein [Anaerolineae bacterium]